MRKKSHVLLAYHIAGYWDESVFYKYKAAFYIGNLLPDIKPSFITKRHEITTTCNIVEIKLDRLLHEKNRSGYNALFFVRLGEVIHYVADYFTFPHNKGFSGTIKEHCAYEGNLKHELIRYVRKMHEVKLPLYAFVGEDILKALKTEEDIWGYIKDKHNEYIREPYHGVCLDCEYIVEVCTTVVFAILQH